LIDTPTIPTPAVSVVQSGDATYVVYNYSTSIKKVAKIGAVAPVPIVAAPSLNCHSCVAGYDCDVQVVYNAATSIKTIKYYDDAHVDLLIFKA
jgi:hypothetical protein